MTTLKTIKKQAAWLLALLLTVSTAAAEEAANQQPEATPSLISAGLSLGIHSISYPQLTGLADPELQNEINAKIVAAGEIDTLLTRLPLVMSNENPMTVTWEGGLYGNLLSIAMCASGPIMPDGRSTEVWSAVNVNLETGSELSFFSLASTDSSNSEIVSEYISDYLEYELAPALSAHLENSELTPIPETWRIDEHGLILYYPVEQLSTLHSRAGVIQVDWYELNQEPSVINDLAFNGNPIYDAGGFDFLFTGTHTAERLAADCAAGSLPGLPVTIGDSVQTLTDCYGLLTDPDWYEAGRMFALDGAAWRNAWLLTDKLSEKTWDASTVNGIRADRISLYGLCTGVSSVNEWRDLLGEPVSTVTIDADTADLWRIVPGTSDYYSYGTHMLRLHADENGVLTTVILQ